MTTVPPSVFVKAATKRWISCAEGRASLNSSLMLSGTRRSAEFVRGNRQGRCGGGHDSWRVPFGSKVLPPLLHLLAASTCRAGLRAGAFGLPSARPANQVAQGYAGAMTEPKRLLGIVYGDGLIETYRRGEDPGGRFSRRPPRRDRARGGGRRCRTAGILGRAAMHSRKPQ
jgi:hypothetical protein